MPRFYLSSYSTFIWDVAFISCTFSTHYCSAPASFPVIINNYYGYPTIASIGSTFYVGYVAGDTLSGPLRPALTWTHDNGATWANSVNISYDAAYPDRSLPLFHLVANGDKLLAGYSYQDLDLGSPPAHLYSREFNINSLQFSSEYKIPPPSIGANCSKSSIAAGPASFYVATFHCGANETMNVYYSFLDFSGASPAWSNPVPLTNRLPNPMLTDYSYTSVAYNGNDGFMALYIAPSSSVLYDIYATSTAHLPSSFKLCILMLMTSSLFSQRWRFFLHHHLRLRLQLRHRLRRNFVFTSIR